MPSTPSIADLLACAVSAARAAGTHALANRHRRHEVYQRLHNDVKLQLDLECQQLATAVVRAAYPEHAVLGEEDAAVGVTGGAETSYQWIIDPIDGTVNFSHGFPSWCSSVAVRRGDEVLAGAVFAPTHAELFTASADGPAACNGEPLHVSAVNGLADALVLTGLDKYGWHDTPPLHFFRRIADSVQRTRVCGSAALDICQVAAGRADGYFESGIYLWDIAAAGLIVQRAGGRAESVARMDVPHRLRFIATNGHIHDRLRETLLA